MQPLRKILAVIDPTTKVHRAFNCAAELAGKTGAKIDAFLCDFDPALSGNVFFDSKGMEKARDDFLRRRQAMIETLVKPATEKGIEVDIDVVWGKRYDEAIIDKARASHAQLVVKETEYHGRLRRALFSSSDWTLIRECPVPVLLTRQKQWRKRPVIIAAVDPMHIADKTNSLDEKILDTADDIASITTGELHIAHWYEPQADIPVEVSVPVEFLSSEELRAVHEKAIAAFLDDRVFPSERLHLVQGPDISVLPALVKRLDAQLVVMGALARGRLERAIIGSTAERVLDKLGCDILIIKPDGFND